jgi:HAE1 family hydrophobic/amphiphilic exporter-1
MTSFAFVAGLIPLVIATGAGAVGNRTIGSSALGGMLAGTMFGVVIVPGLYFIFGHLARLEKFLKMGRATPETVTETKPDSDESDPPKNLAAPEREPTDPGVSSDE